MIGAGMLAVPILTASSAYVLSAAAGWNFGLSERPGRAPQFYGIIAVSTLVGIWINYLGIGPMQALFWTAVINGLLAPVVLVVLMLIANNKKIMGKHTNGPVLNILGWGTAAAMSAAAVALFVFWGR